MEQDKEYYAFISYKREDEKWAKWLQHKLEHYKFPTNLNGRTDLPKRIYPTFRDVTDLTPGLLAEEIDTALRNSQWLIVVCSPRSAKSPWVCKEAQTFIDLGRADHIIPFVIEGNPFSKDSDTECYPEALLNLTGNQELLATNINEMGRDAAAIKVVARMFGLKFDALWQRYEREQRHRMLLITLAAIGLAILGLVIGGIFVNKNRVIANANKQLEKAAGQLRKDSIDLANHIKTILEDSVLLSQQKDSIVQTNALLKKSNMKLEKANKNLIALNAKLVESNNTYSQLKNDEKQYSLAGVLRGNESDLSLMEIVYHPFEPIVAFSDDWGVWMHYLNSNVEVLLSGLGVDEGYGSFYVGVRDLCFSADGSELLAWFKDNVMIWDVKSRKLIEHYSENDKHQIDSVLSSNKFPCINNIIKKQKDDELLTIKYEFKEGLLTVFDKNSDRKICSTELDIGKHQKLVSLYNPVYREILFVTDQKAALYDEMKQSFVLFFKGYGSSDNIEFSESGNLLRIDKNIYTRTSVVDTIRELKYTILPIAGRPKFPNELNREEFIEDIKPAADTDNTTNAIVYVDTTDLFSVIYKRGKSKKKIEVLRLYNLGNGQEHVEDVLFAGPNRIVAIIHHGDHRVYNCETGDLMGTLENYYHFGYPFMSVGHEVDLCHADSYIAASKFINNKLYTLTSGGVIRVYNVDMFRLEAIIILPFEEKKEYWAAPLDFFYLTDDALRIYYSFEDGSFYYVCDLPLIK